MIQGFEKEEDFLRSGIQLTRRRAFVIRSLFGSAIVTIAALSAGCVSPWADEQASPESQPESIDVPSEDREKVEELLRARAEERERLAEANRRREAALSELPQAREALRQWYGQIESPERDEMIRAWQARISALEEEIRQQNITLGRDREDGISPPIPPRPPAPPTAPTPQ